MTKGDKLPGEKRRQAIIQWLGENNAPITGSELAKRSGVSRQVIVQDISLLKAKSYDIFATSQGYMLLPKATSQVTTKLLACKHDFSHTIDELYIMVDHGLFVRDVIIEHPLYGELTASLMIQSRQDADQFYENMRQSKASLLSALTEGIHLHTVEAEHASQIELASQALEKAGILLKETD
ncbi:transcription repressor NadR [Alkalicoccobacillus porphyridii]|uniref:Transcription repressor NadR n=1 Tax=Alkalicoccobacillus porphyridii TaxID=2597270 RepID=A0A553ZWC9_9BACI|nr:transcription repressor NadR [Alkalicoccobacillus porphyridii]TSB45767.1 transcription repressor NadR [Alkalicoccobacillus porphyridii]